MVLAPQPAEQWVTHLADMNWPYAMGAAHPFTYPFLQELARNDYGLTEQDLAGRPFNQLKNYIWSQPGQIALYEILVREGADAARRTVKRLVVKSPILGGFRPHCCSGRRYPQSCRFFNRSAAVSRLVNHKAALVCLQSSLLWTWKT